MGVNFFPAKKTKPGGGGHTFAAFFLCTLPLYHKMPVRTAGALVFPLLMIEQHNTFSLWNGSNMVHLHGS